MAPFTSAHAYTILQRACRDVGEAFDGAELLRLGENASFRLPGASSAIVVRVGRDASRFPVAELELCVSRWLDHEWHLPVARVHEAIPDQPRTVDGHPVTFWQFVEPQPDRPTVVDLAQTLRSLHELSTSPCDLPQFDPLVKVRARLRLGLGLTADDRAFLASRCEVVEAALPGLEFVLPPGPIHGDAHTGNLLGGHGAAVLTDFEVSATGPREWDLVPAAVARTRLGISSDQWKEFVTIYGFDVLAWPGYPVLREARELGMTTWLAQNAGESDAIAREVALRMRSLRDGDRDRAWTAY